MSDENDTGNENGNGTGSTESPYLTKSTMLPVEGVVYCLEHTAVHDDTTDPYGYGQPDCTKKEHRAVYYRARKGDLDERIEEAIAYGNEQHGETHGAGELPEGSAVIDDLSAVQQRVMRKVIAASPDALSDPERVLLLSMVGRARDTAQSAVGALREIFGEADGDVGAVDKHLVLLNSILRKLNDETEETS